MSELEKICIAVEFITLVVMVVVMHFEFRKVKAKVLRQLEQRDAYIAVLTKVAASGDVDLSKAATDVLAQYQTASNNP